jgi:molybdopterin synthase sulfur carrier subunit
MEVEVKLYGQLRRYRPRDIPGAAHHPFKVILEAGTTTVSLAKDLGIPEGMVNATAVNGEAADPDVILQNGDKVSLFPPSAGGSYSKLKSSF